MGLCTDRVLPITAQLPEPVTRPFAKIEECDESDACVLRARFRYDQLMMSYRAFRYGWSGRPNEASSSMPVGPTTKARVRFGALARWDGATDVWAWEVCLGSEIDRTHAPNAARNGF